MGVAPLLTAAVVSTAACLAGAYLVHLRPGFSQRSSLLFVAFAGGSVLGAVFLHLLPEAVRLAPGGAWLAAMASFLGLYLIESHTLPHVHGPHSGDQPGHHVHLGHLAMVGFAAHALSDGLALGVGYRQGVSLAAPAMVAVCAHKLPEGMALYSLLTHGGFPPGRALSLSWVVAWMTPLSAVASFRLVGEALSGVPMGLLLAAVAGSFFYIAACDLLPEVRRSPRWTESLLILAGVLAMLAMRLLE